MSEQPTLGKDMVALVHYRGTLVDSGQVFDSSYERGQPLGFLVGHGMMIPGFERELLGASIGEKRSFSLTPEDAYGDRQQERVVTIPRTEFPDEIELEVGLVLATEVQGQSLQFSVQEVGAEDVIADFNHPLAGQTLQFEVEVLELRPASPEEIQHGHAHGPEGHEH